MILARFAWYRRLRGGYWAQVTAPMGLLSKTRWVRCKAMQPTPDHKWVFYPWAQKTMGNGYIDEWHAIEPCWAVPFSSWVAETIGTNDMACVLGLIREARKAQEILSDGLNQVYCASERSEVMENLRLALLPFENAKTVAEHANDPSSATRPPNA